jgi:hypothetical protein
VREVPDASGGPHRPPEGPPRAAPGDSAGGFAVRLQGATLSDLIQFECLERSMRIVRMRDGARVGYLYFRDGNVVHALDGALMGEAAFRSLLRWQRGSFESCEGAWPARETITTPAQTLMLEAAQEADEIQHRTPRVLAFPGKESIDGATPERTMDRMTGRSPSVPASHHTLLRISADGVAVLAGPPSADTQHLAEVAAYAAQMADLVGDLLVGAGFDVMEVALTSGTCAISRQPNGDLLAVKGGSAADPAAVRAVVEPPPRLR